MAGWLTSVGHPATHTEESMSAYFNPTLVVTTEEQVQALAEAQRLEVSLLQAHIERLRAALREHGIPLPDEDPRLGASDGEHLEQCKAVVRAAYALLGELRTLEQMVGSGVELL
jgi:transposase